MFYTVPPQLFPVPPLHILAYIYLDIQTILGDDNLLLKLYEFVKLRNLENGSVVRYELNGSEWALLLTKNNMQADGSFLDPSTEAKVQVNHYNLVSILGRWILCEGS